MSTHVVDLAPDRSLLAEVRELVEIRAQAPARIESLDRLSATVLGGGFLVIAAICAALLPAREWTELGPVPLLLVVVYAIAYRTEFIAATGSAVPTQPVLVALLFSAPHQLTPLFVLTGLLLGGSLRPRGESIPRAILLRSLSGWHCLGPVAVLWVAHVDQPTRAVLPALGVALLLQFTLDAGVATIRCRALGASPQRLIEPLRFTFSVDLLLSILALACVRAAGQNLDLVLFATIPVVLLRLLATDRNSQLNTAIALGESLATVQTEARADSLTGLANRRAWDERLAAITARTSEEPAADLVATIIMADLDYLKRTNDTFGHEAGDELLRTFASCLSAIAPPGALTARLGGDEFGLLWLGPAGGFDADKTIDDLRVRLSGQTLACGASVSASLGCASTPPLATVAKAALAADAAASADKCRRRAGRV